MSSPYFIWSPMFLKLPAPNTVMYHPISTTAITAKDNIFLSFEFILLSPFIKLLMYTNLWHYNTF